MPSYGWWRHQHHGSGRDGSFITLASDLSRLSDSMVLMVLAICCLAVSIWDCMSSPVDAGLTIRDSST